MDKNFIDAMFKAIALIDTESKKTGTNSGEIKCTYCKDGLISWTKARSNGHVWGKCSTDGCLRWMQ